MSISLLPTASWTALAIAWAALALLSANGDGKVLAGGQTLLPAMKLRLASPSDLVDLGVLRSELSGIRREGDRVIIGALTRHGEIATSEVLQAAIPSLSGMAAIVGDPGIPRVIMGMVAEVPAPWAAASGAMIPGEIPVPNSAAFALACLQKP